MDSEAERTLRNLHVLSSLSHNDKLMTNCDEFNIYTPTSFRGMFRFWYGEDRLHNVERIRHVVRSGTSFAQAEYKRSPDDPLSIRSKLSGMQCARMLDALRGALRGIQNLTQTYQGDAAVLSQLKIVMDELNDFLNVMDSAFRARLAQKPPPPSLELLDVS